MSKPAEKAAAITPRASRRRASALKLKHRRNEVSIEGTVRAFNAMMAILIGTETETSKRLAAKVKLVDSLLGEDDRIKFAILRWMGVPVVESGDDQTGIDQPIFDQEALGFAVSFHGKHRLIFYSFIKLAKSIVAMEASDRKVALTAITKFDEFGSAVSAIRDILEFSNTNRDGGK